MQNAEGKMQNAKLGDGAIEVQTVGTGGLVCGLGHVSALALSMQFTTETPLRYLDCPRKVIPYDMFFRELYLCHNYCFTICIAFSGQSRRLSLRFVPRSSRILGFCFS